MEKFNVAELQIIESALDSHIEKVYALQRLETNPEIKRELSQSVKNMTEIQNKVIKIRKAL